MITSAVDNDILYKGIGYALVFDLIGAIPAEPQHVGVLSAARFVLRARLRKANLSRSFASAVDLLDGVFSVVQAMEPTPEETRLAAELEYLAQQKNVDLDEGESQLCAIVIQRGLQKLVTGDKRAIGALEQVLATHVGRTQLAKKVLCLEQLVRVLVEQGEGMRVRNAVCAEPHVDRALSVCFSCSSPEAGAESWSAGLVSYVEDVRTKAPGLLADS